MVNPGDVLDENGNTDQRLFQQQAQQEQKDADQANTDHEQHLEQERADAEKVAENDRKANE